MRRILICVVSLLLLMAGAAATPAGAMPKSWPMRIDLPDGFAPEGIAIGRGTTFYVGSIPTGALYRVQSNTGNLFTSNLSGVTERIDLDGETVTPR